MSIQKAFAASAVVIGALAGASASHAQSSASSPYYMGTSLGESYSTTGAATKKLINGMDVTTDLRNVSGKAFVGYRKDKNWSTEFGYANFGKASIHAKSAVAVDTFESRLSSFYAALVATENVTEKFSVYGKLGVALNHADGFSDHRSAGLAIRVQESSWNPTPMLGLGAEYQLSRNISLRTEYEYFGRMGSKGVYKTSLVTAGVIYKF